jgi:biopolymer transport protein TolR
MAFGGLGGVGGGRDDMPLNAEINLTPLVDVFLVLLIIFMVAAPIMQGGVDVDLPRAEARPIQADEGMIVTVDRQGQIFVDRTRVSYNDFRVTFRSLVATRKPDAVYLRADTRVAYGEVVRVLAVIRASGIRNVGLVAEEEEGR